MRTIEPRSAPRTASRIGWTTLLMAALFAVPALAQRGEGPPGPPDPGERMERLRETLDLSDDQVDRLREIFDEQREQMRALRQDRDGDREARREAFRSLRDETHERVAGVLSEEQMERYREMVEKRREAMRERRPHRGDRMGPGREGKRPSGERRPGS